MGLKRKYTVYFEVERYSLEKHNIRRVIINVFGTRQGWLWYLYLGVQRFIKKLKISSNSNLRTMLKYELMY